MSQLELKRNDVQGDSLPWKVYLNPGEGHAPILAAAFLTKADAQTYVKAFLLVPAE